MERLDLPRSPVQPALAEIGLVVPYEGSCLTTEMTVAWLHRDCADPRFDRSDPYLAWIDVEYAQKRSSLWRAEGGVAQVPYSAWRHKHAPSLL